MALVSHWTADNTASDSVGANHGSLIKGTAYVAGQVGQAFSFDGVDDRVGVDDSPSLALTGSMSIEAWVRADGLTSQGGVILFRGDDRGGLDPYQLSLQSDGKVKFAINDANNAGAGVLAQFPIGQFVHVVGTLDDATGSMKLYLNSMLVTQSTTSIRPFGALDPASNPGVGIGNHGGYPNTPHNFPFKGLIDELKLYDHALSAAEVSAHFDSEKGALQPSIRITDAAASEQSQFMYKGNLVSPGAVGIGMNDPHQMIYGPDGNLYVSTRHNDSVLRYSPDGAPNPAPGKLGAEFVSPGAGGLSAARGISFGPDGNLYVVSSETDEVLRFSGVDGSPLGALVTAGSGGLDSGFRLLFDGGYLYVSSTGQTATGPGVDSVLRYDAFTGAPAGVSGQPGDAVFISSGSGGLDNGHTIVRHNGDFYIASSNSHAVLRFSASGDFIEEFVPAGSGGLTAPIDIVFHTDGFLYVCGSNKVLRYDGATGAFDREMIGQGLLGPVDMLFEPGGDLFVSNRDSSEIRRYGVTSGAVLTVQSAPWPTAVSVNYATNSGTAQSGADFSSTAGTFTFAPFESSKTIFVPVVDDLTFEPTESFTVDLSSPVGAVIGDGIGAVTITDNDTPPTKFFVVDDASANKTYEYAAAGEAIENYNLNSGNTAPRGAASTAAGDKVWVVDNNRKVYVYDTSGGLLGSWTAGSLANNAQPQGIATNGTDVWIVDARSDKVFKYTGAASLLSGSPNAASSFNLNSGNTSPTDIVTDGSSFWVTNDAATNRVFKYSLIGTHVGNWTIDAANATPTGITLDPASPSDLWIVDAGTDRVYRYAGAVTRTSGGQSAADSFALAPGNANPQGIADPPVSGTSAATTSASSNATPSADAFDAALMAVVGEYEQGTRKKRR